MKNNGVFEAMKHQARLEIIKLLKHQQSAGLQHMRKVYQGFILGDLIDGYKEHKISRSFEGVDKIEALEYIQRVHYDYYSEDFGANDIMECLKNEAMLYIELMEAISTAIYYEEIQHREDYKIKDLITLLQPKEEK